MGRLLLGLLKCLFLSLVLILNIRVLAPQYGFVYIQLCPLENTVTLRVAAQVRC